MGPLGLSFSEKLIRRTTSSIMTTSVGFEGDVPGSPFGPTAVPVEADLPV